MDITNSKTVFLSNLAVTAPENSGDFSVDLNSISFIPDVVFVKTINVTGIYNTADVFNTPYFIGTNLTPFDPVIGCVSLSSFSNTDGAYFSSNSTPNSRFTLGQPIRGRYRFSVLKYNISYQLVPIVQAGGVDSVVVVLQLEFVKYK